MKNIVIPILLFSTIISLGCSSDLTADTTGQVKSVVIDRERKSTRKRSSNGKKQTKTKTSVETDIEYSYTVNGQTFEGFSEKDGDVTKDYQPGAAFTVCYNPAKPEESDIFTSGTKCS